MVTNGHEAAILNAWCEELREFEALYVGAGVATDEARQMAESTSPAYQRIHTVPADWEWPHGRLPFLRSPVSFEGWEGPVAQLGVFAAPEGGEPLLLFKLTLPVRLYPGDILAVTMRAALLLLASGL